MLPAKGGEVTVESPAKRKTWGLVLVTSSCEAPFSFANALAAVDDCALSGTVEAAAAALLWAFRSDEAGPTVAAVGTAEFTRA